SCDFYFSSRRGHTKWPRDWSSDVCSSDLVVWPMLRQPVIGQPVPRKEGRDKVTGHARYIDDLDFPGMIHGVTVRSAMPRGKVLQIGRASCRERVESRGVEGCYKDTGQCRA